MRSVPVILIASASVSFAEGLAGPLRRDGNQVYVTHSAGGCLRVATTIGPDVVLLDPALPSRLEGLLHAHPMSARARILRLSEESAPRSASPVLHAA